MGLFIGSGVSDGSLWFNSESLSFSDKRVNTSTGHFYISFFCQTRLLGGGESLPGHWENPIVPSDASDCHAVTVPSIVAALTLPGHPSPVTPPRNARASGRRQSSLLLTVILN